MDPYELEKAARTLVDIWNRADDTAYRALAGPGFAYRETASGRLVDGIDAVLAEWGRLRDTYPDARADLITVEVRGQTTLTTVRWRATGVRGPAEGRHLELWDLVSVRWHDGVTIEERHRPGLLSVIEPVRS